MQELNHMRRSALEQLRQKLVSSWYRPAVPEQNTETDRVSAAKECDNPPALSVLAETMEQLEETAAYISRYPSSRIRRIYADCRISSRFFEDEKLISILSGLRTEGREIFPAMPHVFREKERIRFEEQKKKFSGFPMDGMLVRSYEEVSALMDCGFDKTIILDHNLYMFNRWAKKFWTQAGITEFTAPVELSSKELAGLGLDAAELIAYGRIPVMVSAQCISSAAGHCRKKSGLIFIEDRFRNRFPVKNYCDTCYNVIYNTLPVYLGNQQEILERLAPRRLRIQFSVENRKQIREVLSLFEGENGSRPVSTEAPFSFTQGHFKRGII